MAERRGPIVLSEETVRLEGYDADAPENPYWEDEEPDPHPNPELGCIRRGKCCKASPGWFAPGEVEQAAAALGMAPDAFVRRYIVIDFIEIDGARVEVFAPLKIGRDKKPLIPPATRTDALYQGLRSPCVFYDGQGCRIYAARPIECRHYVCTNPPEQNMDRQEIGRMWRAALAGEG